MKKSLFIAVLVLMLLLSSCTTTGKNETIRIEKTTFKEDMLKIGDYATFLFTKTELTLENEETTVELYVFAGAHNDNGVDEIVWDDGHPYSLLVRRGDFVYPIIDKQWVQIGDIEYSLWEDSDYSSDSSLYIIVTISQGACMNIYEYSFNPQEQIFEGREVYGTKGKIDRKRGTVYDRDPKIYKP